MVECLGAFNAESGFKSDMLPVPSLGERTLLLLVLPSATDEFDISESLAALNLQPL
jgi:hypothetical protein